MLCWSYRLGILIYKCLYVSGRRSNVVPNMNIKYGFTNSRDYGNIPTRSKKGTYSTCLVKYDYATTHGRLWTTIIEVQKPRIQRKNKDSCEVDKTISVGGCWRWWGGGAEILHLGLRHCKPSCGINIVVSITNWTFLIIIIKDIF